MKTRIYATPAVKGLNVKHTSARFRVDYQTHYLIIAKKCQREGVGIHVGRRADML